MRLRHPRAGGDPSCRYQGLSIGKSAVFFRKRHFFAIVWSGRELVGPVRPLRNSLAGLVGLNRCVQGVAVDLKTIWQRFRQRCLARSDSRSNLPGPTSSLHGATLCCFDRIEQRGAFLSGQIDVVRRVKARGADGQEDEVAGAGAGDALPAMGRNDDHVAGFDGLRRQVV
jgi:hypothetical protein